MKNNENGFTYPLTLSVLIVFLIFFSVNVEQLQSERKMAHETKKILKQEYYMMSSAKKIEKRIQNGDSIQTNGVFIYKGGKVDYLSSSPLDGIQKVTFTLQLESGEVASGIGYYDINVKKMSKWVEKN
jgi:hypothetical protein